MDDIMKVYAKERLAVLRGRLDDIDGRIAALCAERFAMSGELRRCKQALGRPVCDPVREAEVIARARARVPEEHRDAVEGVFRAVIRETRALQEEREKQ